MLKKIFCQSQNKKTLFLFLLGGVFILAVFSLSNTTVLAADTVDYVDVTKYWNNKPWVITPRFDDVAMGYSRYGWRWSYMRLPELTYIFFDYLKDNNYPASLYLNATNMKTNLEKCESGDLTDSWTVFTDGAASASFSSDQSRFESKSAKISSVLSEKSYFYRTVSYSDGKIMAGLYVYPVSGHGKTTLLELYNTESSKIIGRLELNSDNTLTFKYHDVGETLRSIDVITGFTSKPEDNTWNQISLIIDKQSTTHKLVVTNYRVASDPVNPYWGAYERSLTYKIYNASPDRLLLGDDSPGDYNGSFYFDDIEWGNWTSLDLDPETFFQAYWINQRVWDELQDLHDNYGVEIGAHGREHYGNSRTDEERINDTLGNISDIEAELPNVSVMGYAWPGGQYDPEVADAITTDPINLKYAQITSISIIYPPADWKQCEIGTAEQAVWVGWVSATTGEWTAVNSAINGNGWFVFYRHFWFDEDWNNAFMDAVMDYAIENDAMIMPTADMWSYWNETQTISYDGEVEQTNYSRFNFSWLDTSPAVSLTLEFSLSPSFPLYSVKKNGSSLSAIGVDARRSGGFVNPIEGYRQSGDTLYVTVVPSASFYIDIYNEEDSGPAIGTGGNDEEKDWCFIATAAYGTPMASEVRVLSKFRDEYLLTNSIGEVFVRTYYKVSPTVALFIREHPILKKAVRGALNPLIWMSEKSIE